jgi:hypothetical protein
MSMEAKQPNAAAMRAVSRIWDSTHLKDYETPKAAAIIDDEIQPLISQIAALRAVCAEAYQLAGLFSDRIENAKLVLDNLSAAANGEPIPHETFLPIDIIEEESPKSEIQPLVEALRNMLARAGCRCDTSVCYYCRTGFITVGEQAVDQARAALRRAEGGGE